MFNRFAEQLQPVLADLEGFSDRSDLSVEERKQRDHDIRLALAYLNSIRSAMSFSAILTKRRKVNRRINHKTQDPSRG
jgi:hypothetical protein